MKVYYLKQGKLKQEETTELKPIKDYVVYEVWNIEELKSIFPHFRFKDISLDDFLEESSVKIEEFEDAILLVLHKPYVLADDWDYEQITIAIKGKSILIFRGPKSENIILRVIRKFFSKRPLSKEFFIYLAIERFLSEYSSLADFIEFRIRELEKQITDPETQIIEQTYDIRDLILDIKQILVGYRDVVFTLKSNPSFVKKREIFYYIRDLYDKVSDVYRDIENLQERTANLMSVYLLYANFAFGDTMQVLTALTTIFLPMTLIASIYGMNFKNMPELYHPLGYYFALFLIFGVGVVSFILLKKKKLI